MRVMDIDTDYKIVKSQIPKWPMVWKGPLFMMFCFLYVYHDICHFTLDVDHSSFVSQEKRNFSGFVVEIHIFSPE